MRHLAITLALLAGALLPAGAYTDHRGHNVDSLERVVARWTPEAVDNATEEELIDLNRAYRDLMLGYEVINGEKAVFYARKAIAISRRKGWTEATGDAAWKRWRPEPLLRAIRRVTPRSTSTTAVPRCTGPSATCTT